MSLTRENAETMIVADLQGLMTAAGMTITHTGANAHLNGPIGRALRDLGYSVADITDVTDADVAQVTDAQIAEFIDLMIMYTLEAIMGWLANVDITVGPRTEKLSQLAGQVERKIKVLRARMKEIYGYGLSVVVAGYLQKDIAEHD